MATGFSLKELNKGPTKPRKHFVFLLTSVVSIGVFFHYSHLVNSLDGESKHPIDQPSSVKQCQALFTINPEDAIDAQWNSKHNSPSLALHDMTSTPQNDEDIGLMKALVLLTEARLAGGPDTEFYEDISRTIPSLLLPLSSSSAKDDKFRELSSTGGYNEGVTKSRNTHTTRKDMTWTNVTALRNVTTLRNIMVAGNITRYLESFLNKTKGFVPKHLTMKEIPENPFPLGPSDASLTDTATDKYDVAPFSRLMLSNGRLPYVPCKVRFYSNDDLRQCVSRRKDRNATTWIGFVGDSKLRSRFEHILDSASDFGWKMYLYGLEVPWEFYDRKMRPLKIQGNTDAHSVVGLRASMAFAPGGDIVYIAERDVPVEEVTDWLQEGKDLPDIIVMGFGAWIYSRAHNKLLSSLMAPDRMITRWQKMKGLVRKLAKRTTVLLVPQTRFRPHVVKSSVPHNDSTEAKVKWWRELLYKERFLDHSNDWIDKVMSHFARGTGAILWDSTLPMNLANVRECGLLTQGQQKDHPAYSDVMHCNDGHHPAPLTLQDEVTMLLNLLCNRDLNAEDEHCCS